VKHLLILKSYSFIDNPTRMTDKLKDIVIDYLNKEYSGLVRYETEECEYYVFYFLNDEKIIIYNRATKDVLIRNSIVWSFLENLFGLSDKEISNILLEWIENQCNITTTNIDHFSDYQFNWVCNK
jgi:acyl carrier protein